MKASSKSKSRPKMKKTITTIKTVRQIEREKSPFHRRQQNARKKKHPGQKAIRAIAHNRYEGQTCLMLPKSSFTKLLRSVCDEQSDEHYRWTTDALTVMQSAAEDYMVGLFQDSHLCTLHCKRMTLMARDLQLARRIRGLNDPGNR